MCVCVNTIVRPGIVIKSLMNIRACCVWYGWWMEVLEPPYFGEQNAGF